MTLFTGSHDWVRVWLFKGDSAELLKSHADNSVDSIVTDPPYALEFMGKLWDTGDTAHAVAFWAECLRVLKPGGYLLAFGGTRTYHRLACAIEDAGFEIRDMVQWLYGQGFPKSLDVSKAMDKAVGAVREVVGLKSDPRYLSPRRNSPNHMDRERGVDGGHGEDNSVAQITAPATDAAREWQGWGTALKPANEPICMARKPLSEGTVAANVLKWGTGAINIDGCRVDSVVLESEKRASAPGGGSGGMFMPDGKGEEGPRHNPAGRFPANVITDGSDEVVGAFPDTRARGNISPELQGKTTDNIYGKYNKRAVPANPDSGSAARFFYSAKASKADRAGSKHPTVKPVALMRYLCRLVTPPGGIVLDPFAGTGTTGEAAYLEGFKVIMIENEAPYCADIRSRMAGLNVNMKKES